MNMALCSADTGVCDKCDRCDYRRVWLSSERLLKSFYSAITLSELFVLGNDHPLIRAIMSYDGETAGRMLGEILSKPTRKPAAKSRLQKAKHDVSEPVDESIA